MSEAPFPEKRVKSVGSILREARESRRLSIEEASGVTRMGKTYLLALENDDYDRLPGPAYVKGFIRAYASFLGLSGDELLTLYEDTIHPLSAYEDEPSDQPQKGKIGLQDRNRWTVPLFLLVLVVLTAYVTSPKDEKPVEVSRNVVPVKVAPVPPPAKVGDAPALAPRPAAPAKPDETLIPPPVESGGQLPQKGIILKLKVNNDCQLNITIDGELTQQYDLKSGDLIEWKGARAFSLDLGNAGGVEAEFNGKNLPPFGDVGKPAHVVLKAEGTEE